MIKGKEVHHRREQQTASTPTMAGRPRWRPIKEATSQTSKRKKMSRSIRQPMKANTLDLASLETTAA
eukprot:12265182-Karenia_brevis.AAC.1